MRFIQRFGLSEPDAYRRLQKVAMDTRRPMSEVARPLLVTETWGSPRSAK